MNPTKENILVVLRGLKDDYSNLGLEKFGLGGAYALENESKTSPITILYQFSDEANQKAESDCEFAFAGSDMLVNLINTIENTFKKEVELIELDTLLEAELELYTKGAIYV